MSLRLEENYSFPAFQGKPLTLHVNDKAYTIIFGHHARCPSITICTITGDSLLSKQYATCSPHDTFSRALGRKIALARAVWQAFPREQRKAFWTAYWLEREKRTGKKWAA